MSRERDSAKTSLVLCHVRFNRYMSYSYFSECVTCAVLFREMVSINELSLIKIVKAIFEKITILPLFLELEYLYSPDIGP
jgi:hypothetical protein